MPQITPQDPQDPRVRLREDVLRVLGHSGPIGSANAVAAMVPHRRIDTLRELLLMKHEGLIGKGTHGWYSRVDRPSRSGLQVSYRKAVQALSAYLQFEAAGRLPEYIADQRATRVMRAALSDKQRARLDGRDV